MPPCFFNATWFGPWIPACVKAGGAAWIRRMKEAARLGGFDKTGANPVYDKTRDAMPFFVSLRSPLLGIPDRTPFLRLLGRADGRVDWSALAPGYIIPGFAITLAATTKYFYRETPAATAG